MDLNIDFSKNNDKSYEDLRNWVPFTIGHHLKNWAHKYKDRIAVVEDDKSLSYFEMNQKAHELAAGFINIGLKKGDIAVVQLPNSISFILTCFALLKIGCVPVLAMPAHRETELEGIFKTAKPKAYFICDNYLGFDYTKMANELVKKHESVKFLITDSTDSKGLKLLDLGMPGAALPKGPLYDDTAFLLLSGGTTGTPKLIPRTHMDYFYNASESAMKCRLNQNSVYLAVLPMAHNFPLSCPGILGTFFCGGKVVVCHTTSPDEAFELIEQHKVTITALVPAIANIWVQASQWEESDISSLELVQVGGSVLDKKLAVKIQDNLGCKLQQVFGMAEGLVCYTSLDDDDSEVFTSQGKPLSVYDEIRIVDENGNDVEKGEEGELMVRGPYTIKGYYKAFEQNLKDFTNDGFYKSGDKVRINSKGNIQVMGRIKEQINRAGEKITASEIESYLNMHEDIEDSALIAVKDNNLGERSCAFIICENKKITIGDIRLFFENMKIASNKVPDQIEFIDSWPLTSVGKVDKKKLLQKVLEKEEKPLHYYEEVIDFKGDALAVGCMITDSGLFENYLLYENKNEFSIGLEIHSVLTVDFENTILKTGNKTHIFENKDLSKTIKKAFSFVDIKDWRSYGTADFELAGYNYNVDSKVKEGVLLKLFIPKSEVRIYENNIVLRSLDHEDLKKLKALVESVLNENQETEFKTDLHLRVLACKNNTPEIGTHNADNYKKIVEAAVAEIKTPLYQKVILSRKIPLDRKIDMTASYFAGRKANTPARSFLLKIDDLRAAGFSPETVVEVDENRIVSTQPLAGTRSMGKDQQEEIKLMEELINDSKEIAEHAISIKLAYEEMLLVCSQDSITLSDFMTIAKRGTVQHLASRLKGRLKEDYNSWHAFNALFPAVTATGIPKKESIESIFRYESSTRNLYSGCVITYDSSGKMDAALVLRSFFAKNNESWLQAGAGIVDLSKPERELEETCEKLRSVSNQIIYCV